MTLSINISEKRIFSLSFCCLNIFIYLSHKYMFRIDTLENMEARLKEKQLWAACSDPHPWHSRLCVTLPLWRGLDLLSCSNEGSVAGVMEDRASPWPCFLFWALLDCSLGGKLTAMSQGGLWKSPCDEEPEPASTL